MYDYRGRRRSGWPLVISIVIAIIMAISRFGNQSQANVNADATELSNRLTMIARNQRPTRPPINSFNATASAIARTTSTPTPKP